MKAPRKKTKRGWSFLFLSITTTILLLFNFSHFRKFANLEEVWHVRSRNHKLFGFYLMGDIPYANWEEEMLEKQIANITNHRVDHSVFTVHVGDIQKAHRTNCEKTYYQKIRSILLQNSLPTVVLPGDNDWYDCGSREESWKYFKHYFNNLETQWETLPTGVPRLDIQRWDRHPEYFVFEHERILFVSIHLIHGDPEDEAPGVFDKRTERSISWVNQNVKRSFNETPDIRGVIILGHSLRSPWTRPFFEGIAGTFVNSTRRAKIPVLYLHGDGHKWEIDTKFSQQLEWENYRDVQVDAGGFADPCLVEVAPQVDGRTIPLVKEHELQYLFGNGLFRIDRQRGRYSEDILNTMISSKHKSNN